MSACLHVLIVEDERVVSMTLSRMVTRLGHKVVGKAPSGQRAMELFSETGPDLVLMDIMLEGDMDGIETARRLLEQGPVHIVYVTAYGDAPTRARAMETSPAGFVHKPVDFAALQQVIQSLPCPRGNAEGGV